MSRAATAAERPAAVPIAWALAAGAMTLAGLSLAVVATRYADVTERSPVRPDGGWRAALLVGLIVAFAAYGVGLWALARGGARLAAVVALAAAIQLAPLAAPLLLSTDAYSYWAYGRIAAVHDANPYADRPSEFPDDPAYERMGADWRDKTSVYGPAFTIASEGVAEAAGRSPDAATWLFRGLAALGALALVLLAAAAAPRPAFAAAFVGWNPLLALHFAGGGHNDVLAMAFVLGALALAARGRAGLGGAAWALALSVKAFPLVFLPLRALAERRRGRSLGAVGFAAAGAVIAALGFALYAEDWLRVFSPVANQLRRTSSLGLPYWLGKIGVPERVAVNGLVVAFALVYLWLLREAWRGRARLALAACALLLATAWLQPWYAVWAVPLAAVEEDRLARGLALALSAYFLRDALPL